MKGWAMCRAIERRRGFAEREQREAALANTLMRVSDIIRATGDNRQALEVDRTALEMRRRLLDRRPEALTRLRNVAASLTATNASPSSLGGFRGVLELQREALEI